MQGDLRVWERLMKSRKSMGLYDTSGLIPLNVIITITITISISISESIILICCRSRRVRFPPEFHLMSFLSFFLFGCRVRRGCSGTELELDSSSLSRWPAPLSSGRGLDLPPLTLLKISFSFCQHAWTTNISCALTTIIYYQSSHSLQWVSEKNQLSCSLARIWCYLYWYRCF